MNKIEELRNAVVNLMFKNSWIEHNILGEQNEEVIDWVLPKTKQKAIMNLAVQAICIEHDKNIHGNITHLFRLPYNIEMELHARPIVETEKDYNVILEELAGGFAVETQEGPVNIGAVSELNEDYIIQAFAKHYLDAFKGGYKTYPYLR